MKKSALLISCLAMVLSSGCASRKFMISSKPEGAYIVGYGETSQDNPLNETLVFVGKSDLEDLVAMKRGYHPDTITVSKNSPAEVYFQLKPLEARSKLNVLYLSFI